MDEDARRHLPLKPIELELLLALGNGELHGYGLTQAIAERTEGVVKLEPGNLYRVIRRLLGAGLLEETDRRPAPDQADERRRYYALTGLGARVAAAELKRLSALVESADAQALLRRWAT